jgi:hypothetical protein
LPIIERHERRPQQARLFSVNLTVPRAPASIVLDEGVQKLIDHAFKTRPIARAVLCTHRRRQEQKRAGQHRRFELLELHRLTFNFQLYTFHFLMWNLLPIPTVYVNAVTR